MKLTDIFKTNQKQTKIKAKLNLTNIVKEEILGEDEIDWDFDFDQTDPAAREAEKDMKKYQKKRKGGDTDEDVLLGGDVEEAAPKGLEKSDQRPHRLKPDMFWKRHEDDSTSVMQPHEIGKHENELIKRLFQSKAGVIPNRRETIKAMRDDEGNYIGDDVKQNYPHIDNVLSQEQIEALKAAPGGVQGSQRDQVKYSQVAHEVADEYGYDIVQKQGWTKAPGTSKSVPVFKNTLHQGSHYNDQKSYYDKHGYDVEKSDYEIKAAAADEKRKMANWAREEREEARRKGELKMTAAKGAVEMDMTDPQLTKDELLNLSIGQMRQLDKQFTYGIFDALSDDLSDDEKEAIEDEFDSIMAYKAETAAKAKATRKKTQRMVDRGEKEATMTARQKMEDDEKFKKGIEDLKKRHNKKKKPRDGDANEATEYYKSKRKSDDLYYKKVGNKWYKSLASKKGKVEWYVVKYPGDLDSRDMNKINKSKLPSELNEASDKIQVQGVGVYEDVDETREERRSSAPIPFETTARAPEDKEGRNAARSAWADIEKYHDEQKKKKKPVLPQKDKDILPVPAGMIDVGDYTGEGDEKLDPRQKKRKQGKNFKGYKNTMPYTNRKFYPNMSDEEWKAKQGDNVDEDRRDPNITRGPKGLGKYTLDYDKKKKTFDSQGNPREGGFIVPARKRKGDDVDEISMQQARKSYGVGQGKTMASKQRQTKGLGGIGSSQRNFAKRHKAIGAKTGRVRKSVGGPKVVAQTQKRKRAAKMSDMVKKLGGIGRKALYGGDDSVREQKVIKLNKKQLLEFIKETIKETIND